MRKKEIWYLCDPGKNEQCRKRSCYQHKGPCMLTKDRNAAICTKSGKAVIVIVRRTSKGFVKEVKEEGQADDHD